ncbi:MAG: metallophosphoesterase [Fibrobacteres bacterium]|nr:metallophosphoesterase [Fibrobacterota bacterium]
MSSPTDPKPKVPSNGTKQFGLEIPAVILYPSLGAPTFVSESETVHLLMLSKTGLEEAEVNERLVFLDDFEALKRCKHGLKAPTDLSLLFEDPSNILVDPLPESKDVPQFIDDIGLRGFLNPEILALWRKTPESDTRTPPPLEKLYHIAIPLSKLTGNAKNTTLKRKFFMHWLDYGIKGRANPAETSTTNASSETIPSASYQEERLFQILSKTRQDSDTSQNIFVGDRLWNFLTEARPGDTNLQPSLDPSGLLADTRLPLTDWHPVHRKPKKAPPGTPEEEAKPAAALDLAVISDLHLVTKLQILKNSEMVTIPDVPEDLIGTEDSSFVRPIGSMISETVTVLKDLFEKLKDGPDAPDAVLVVGDLVDFSRDNFPKDRTALMARYLNPVPPSRLEHSLKIWDALNLLHFSKSETSAQEFFEPRLQMGTSYMGVYHLIADFQASCTKPIFLVAGNHDGYIDPFGISPRADFGDAQDATEHQKANEGIACDTNLTFLEATTAFGPGYNKFTHALDFDVNVYQLFFLLFSPFKSWTISGGTKQQLLLMDWGPSEMMFLRSNGPNGMDIGHLPHADKAIPECDLQLIEFVAQKHGSDRRVVQVSHFTYACYSPAIPLVENFQFAPQQSGVDSDAVSATLTTGEDNIKSFPKADIGTIGEGALKGALIGAAIGTGVGAAAGVAYGIHNGQSAGDVAKDAAIGGGIGLVGGALIGAGTGAVLSAGSDKKKSNWHNYGTFNYGRERVFQLIQKGAKGGIAYTLSGHAHRAAFYTPVNLVDTTIPDEIKVRGWHLDEFRILAKNPAFDSNQCVMIVSDSAGPIPRKNRRGELNGWGSQLPSWTLCGFNENGELSVLRSVPTSNRKSVPRLAVSMDYLESTIGRLDWTTGLGLGSLAGEGTLLLIKKAVAGLYNLFPGHKPWDPEPAAMPRHLFWGEDLPFIWAPQLPEERLPDEEDHPPGKKESTGIVLDLGTGRREEWLISGILNLYAGPIFSFPKVDKLPAITLESSLWPLNLPTGFQWQHLDVLCQWNNKWYSFRLTPSKRKAGTTAIEGDYRKNAKPDAVQVWTVSSGSLAQTEDLLPALAAFCSGKKKKPAEMTCWISHRITGRTDYDTSPWLIESKLCVAFYQEKWTILMYRKIWENERPNFGDFRH